MNGRELKALDSAARARYAGSLPDGVTLMSDSDATAYVLLGPSGRPVGAVKWTEAGKWTNPERVMASLARRCLRAAP